MKIYTKTGDKGYTSLIGGTRVTKDHLRIEAYGTVDELNSYLGLVESFAGDALIADIIHKLQNELFTAGALLAADPERNKMPLPELTASDIQFLEDKIDEFNACLPELRHFILPGGSQASSFCQVARCVCRRAERLVVKLSEISAVDERIVIYLNRLSDFLFILARKLCIDAGNSEIKWFPREAKN